jgi:hypothetical protein
VPSAIKPRPLSNGFRLFLSFRMKKPAIAISEPMKISEKDTNFLNFGENPFMGVFFAEQCYSAELRVRDNTGKGKQGRIRMGGSLFT